MQRFRAFFSVEDKATTELRKITAGSKALAASAGSTSVQIRNLGNELKKATQATGATAGLKSTEKSVAGLNKRIIPMRQAINGMAEQAAQDATRARSTIREMASEPGADKGQLRELNRQARQTENLSRRIRRLGEEGMVTSGSLRSLSQNFSGVAQKGNVFGASFSKIGTELNTMSNKMKKFEGESTRAMSRANAGTSNLQGTQRQAALESKKLSEEFHRLSLSGNLSGATLNRLASRATAIATLAAPALQSRLQGVSASLREMAIQAQATEATMKRSGSQFAFMEDVSEKTQKGFRRLSAASQGLMLSMGALDGNLQSLAFSLIFLQFSGAIKTSLAFAALSGAAMIAFKGVKKYLDQRKEMKLMADAVNLVSGNTQAFVVIQEKARAIVSELPIAGKDATDFIKGLSSIMTELRVRGIEPTEEALQVFTSVMAFQMEGRGKNAKDAMNEAATSVLDFAESTDKTRVKMEDWKEGIAFDDLLKLGADALDDFAKVGEVDMGKLRGFIEDGTIKPTEELIKSIKAAGDEWNILAMHEQQAIMQLLTDAGLAVNALDANANFTVESFKQAFEVMIPASLMVTIENINGITQAIEDIDPKDKTAEMEVLFQRAAEAAKEARKQVELYNLEHPALLPGVQAEKVVSDLTYPQTMTPFHEDRRFMDVRDHTVSDATSNAWQFAGGSSRAPMNPFDLEQDFIRRQALNERASLTTPSNLEMDYQMRNPGDSVSNITVNVSGNFTGTPEENGKAISLETARALNSSSMGYNPRISSL